MRSRRRLSVVSFGSLSAMLVLCAASLRAQTVPAPPAPPVLQNAWPFVVPMPPLVATGQSAPQPPTPATTLRLPPLPPAAISRLETLNTQKLSLLARNEGPCYTLRTYGFTSGHDPASAPRLSSHTTCTPASQSHVKELVKTPQTTGPDNFRSAH